MTATRERPHGLARYKHRRDPCRCYTCCLAYSLHCEERNKLIAEGRWEPYVDGDEIREHVRQILDGGATQESIGVAAGVSRSMLNQLLRGKPGMPPTARVRTPVAQRLLAISPGTVHVASAAAWQNAVGTQRRIQALCAMGWTLSSLAARIGWNSKSTFTNQMRHQWVYRATAEKTAALYDELSMIPAGEEKWSRRARNDARRKGWFPPLAWDDDTIDDPAATPALLPPVEGSNPAADEWAIQHLMADHEIVLDRVTQVEVVWRLTAEGWSVPRIAKRLGRSSSFVSEVRKELGIDLSVTS